jgi:L-threonylcarbamoyladenylate synthase
MPRLLAVDPHAPDPAALDAAVEVLRRGGLVAFPTETVYGLGADARNPEAVARIFAAKGRPAGNPLIVHVSDARMLGSIVSDWPPAAVKLAVECWPGPLTLVLPRSPGLPPAVTAGLPAVGVRMPAHPVALALIRRAGFPIAAPSANPYTGVSPTSAAHVAAGLGDRVDLILDGGPAEVGLESTVLDLTGAVPTVLRPGGLPLPRLRELLGQVDYRVVTKPEHEALPSPGLARRHYAPRARVRVLADPLAEARSLLTAGEGPLGVWSFTPLPEGIQGVVWARDPVAYGAGLYAGLHEADARGWKYLLIEAPPEGDDWVAVRDRLRRAGEAPQA